MKYIIVFIYFFSCFLLTTSSTPQYDLYYRPMTKRTVNFGNDVCYYEDNAADFPFYAYVKPCEEGKKCVALDTSSSSKYSEFNIHICQEYNFEVYDNEGTTCETKDSHFPGLDCTGYSCDSDEKCYNTCPKDKVSYYDINDHKTKCADNPGYCLEVVEFDNSNGDVKSQKDYYSNDGNRQCIQIELAETQKTSSKYQVKKKKYASIASIDDGNYIEEYNSSIPPPVPIYLYCKSGYALYFYGDGKLKNPNTNTGNSEQMYLRCVTVLGKDSKGIIKYKIGENGDEKYYDPRKLFGYSLDGNDDYLMLRLGFFKNYKERLDKVGCSDTGDCEDNDLIKWRFFYNYPEYYYLYQNEPQVLEFFLQKYNPKYKAKYTSPDGSSLLNIKYLTLLSLLLLF